jgi:hypothetical protein
MKKQLFLSVALLALSMEVSARITGAGSNTPGSGAANKKRQLPPPPGGQTPPGGQGTSSAATQTVGNHPDNTTDLIAGALSALGESLAGYTVPSTSDTAAIDAYHGGMVYVQTGNVQ